MGCAWSCGPFLVLIGIADATAVDRCSSGGGGDMPAGEAIEEGKMNSSRFMGSA